MKFFRGTKKKVNIFIEIKIYLTFFFKRPKEQQYINKQTKTNHFSTRCSEESLLRKQITTKV